MKQFFWALLIILVFVPISIFVATLLWNMVLVQVVTWANPINFWQMFGLMALLYLIWPGTKVGINNKNKKNG
jgi:energy-coupling factor transporter transmembrane protein EcfT